MWCTKEIEAPILTKLSLSNKDTRQVNITRKRSVNGTHLETQLSGGVMSILLFIEVFFLVNLLSGNNPEGF